LFTAHVTGNIVIAIAEIMQHDPGVLPKIVAIPLFVVIATMVTSLIEKYKEAFYLLIGLLIFEALLFAIGMYGGISFLKDAPLNSWSYFLVGMMFVSAMALHNTLLRTYMTNFPPCTVMTGNLTQFTVDFTTFCWNRHLDKEDKKYKKTARNLRNFGNVLVGFTLGGILSVIGLKLVGFLASGFPILIIIYVIIRLNISHRDKFR
jgi:uncharacterized membrane protein YoaK (UPF0700 family)